MMGSVLFNSKGVAVELVARLFRGDIIHNLRSFNSDIPSEVFDFSWNFFFGFIRPMQVKYEFLKLLEVFRGQNPRYILEIGTANGGSLFSFCKLAEDDATIISIDLPGGDFGGGYPEWKIPVYTAFAGENQKLVLLRKDSHKTETLNDVKKLLGDNKLDFLFIDGDHSYEGVKRDFELYSPLVREGGIIAFHDIAPHWDYPEVGVTRFWDEIKGEFRSEEFIADVNQGWAGIGILYW